MFEEEVLIRHGELSFCEFGKETGEVGWTFESGWVVGEDEDAALEPLDEESWW